MKKLVVLSITMLFSLAAQALNFTVDNLKYSTNTDGVSVSVSGYVTKLVGKVEIPSIVTDGTKSYAVTSIGNRAFFDCSGLTSITLPSGVTSIGGSAFYLCSGLTSISLPSKVTSIGSSAFYRCSGLTSITIPSGVTSIEYEAFSGCNGLTSITLPSGVTSIGGSAFYFCSGLTSITLPSGVTSIGSSAFSNCSGLTSITIPSGVTSIGSSAFFYCSGLRFITCLGTIPASVGTDCFQYVNQSLCMLLVPPSAVTAYSSATGWLDFEYIFEEGTVVDYDVTLHEAGSLLTTIGMDNLKKVSSLTITGPMNGTDILIIRTKLPLLQVLHMENATIVSGGVAYYTDNVSHFTADNQIGESMFYNMPLKSVIIPSGVTSIGDNAFSGCSLLASITLPSGVTLIGDRAFYYCNSLTSITIPSGVTLIGDWAFYDCSSLTSISLPSGVTSIGSSAFSSCRGLTSITLPSGVTSIGSSAFSSCRGLTSITLPSSVTSIGSEVFAGCSGLKEIHTLNLIPPPVASSVFYSVDKVSCILYVPQGKYFDYFLASGWGDFKNIVEENVAGEDLIKQNATLKVYTATDAIVIEGAEYGEEISVCTESGALIQRFNAVDNVIRITVPQNAVYLIKTPSQTVKVAL
ncbi:MAG: leucine-rich repeat domain-containing protein [Bacteroidales bacterium]|nr:leucine-rich repeat domain-containing protein [Bacteroidales bacterium]